MKTMRKTTMMKMSATLVAMFFALSGMFAQEIPADFENAALGTPASISYVTINKTMPFWVVPDPVFHTGYVAPGWVLTPDFTWNWTVPAGLTLASQVNNYVTITAGTLGDYVVNVKEQAPAAWGGCEDATGTDITIRVVEAPEFHSFPFFASIPLASGDTYQTCAPYAAFDANIELSGFPNFGVEFTLTQQALTAAGVPTGPVNTLVTNAVVGGGNSLTRVTNQTYVVDGARTLGLIAAGTRTQYVYTFTGVTDNVSRKSDYLSAATLYGGGPYTFTFIVNPAPTTGPIFHIPNTFGNL
jgi:hypothetical protein